MYEFHKDTEWYFEMQTLNAEKSVIPFIEKKLPLSDGLKVLEVGCAEGGVIKAFVKRGCEGVGVELSESRLKKAVDFNKDYVDAGKLKLIAKNIYDPSFTEEFEGQFDLIVLKDVIEHIFDQDKLMVELKRFLKPEGYIFFGFPPFNMPFGGHQQVSQSRVFSKTPYIHLLPMFFYKAFMKLCGEHSEEFVEIKETGISTARFEKIVRNTGMEIVHEKHYLINPIYEYKFGLKPRRQFALITAIPHLRDFLTTCVFYLVKK